LFVWRLSAQLISPQFVRPYVKGNKNDFVDAEAICEAASRPSMRFVSPKTEAQQTLSALHRLRESLVRDHTKTANQRHGFLLEFEVSLPRGLAIMKRLPVILTNMSYPLDRVYLQQLKSQHGALAEWVRSLLIRQHSNVAACALANKLARIAWAISAGHGIFNAGPDVVAI